MCGIGGVWVFEGEELDRQDAEKLKSLAYCLEERGTDAFGFYNGDEVIKFPSRASQVIPMINKIKPFYKLVKGRKMFLMHTRLATIGEPINNANNHPFETKDFVLAHNGTISYYKRYVDKTSYKFWRFGSKGKGDAYDVEVIDKEAIFGSKVAEIPETDTFTLVVELQKEFNEVEDELTAFRNAMSDLYYFGVFALWIYSKRKDMLMLYRDDNPLYISLEGEKLWFASEKWMLETLKLDAIIPVESGYVRVYDRGGLVEVEEVVDVDTVNTRFQKKGRSYKYAYDYSHVSYFDCKKDCEDYEECMEYKRQTGLTLCESYRGWW